MLYLRLLGLLPRLCNLSFNLVQQVCRFWTKVVCNDDDDDEDDDISIMITRYLAVFHMETFYRIIS